MRMEENRGQWIAEQALPHRRHRVCDLLCFFPKLDVPLVMAGPLASGRWAVESTECIYRVCSYRV